MQTFDDLKNLSPEDQNKAAIIGIWSARATVYGETLNEMQLKKYSDLTAHLPAKTLIKLLDAHMLSEWGHLMPNPSHVFKMARKGLKLASEDDATDIAQEIYRVAMSDGLSRTKFLGKIPIQLEEGGEVVLMEEKDIQEKKAKKRLSETAWNFVEKSGGWYRIASSIVDCNYNQLNWIAQTRDAIKSSIRKQNDALLEKVSDQSTLTLDDLRRVGLEYVPKLINTEGETK